MTEYQKPPNIMVGPSRQALDVKILPYADGRPTHLILSGPRAYARFLLARKLAGNRHDQTSKQSFNLLDEALHRPFAVVQNEMLGYLRLMGLNVTYDEQAVGDMVGELQRVQAPYSRSLPVEDDSGEIVGWKKLPSGIHPQHLKATTEALTYLGWDQYLFPFAFEGAAEILTKRDVLLTMSMGSGKSRMALALAETWKHLEGTTTPTIILANKRHLGAWREELGGVPEVKACELLTAQYGAGCYEEWVEKDDLPTFRKPFLLVSLDRAKIFTDSQLELFLSVAKTSTIILDEAYVAQNPGSGLTKFLHKVVGAHHIGVTGTPWRSYVAALCPVMLWVFRGGGLALPEYPLGRDGTYKKWNEHFMSHAVSEDGGSRRRTPFLKNPERFWALMAPLMYRRLRNEPDVEAVLGKAVVQEEHREVDLTPEHDRTYRAVLGQFTEWYKREVDARRKRGESAVMPEQEILVKLGYLINNVRAPWRMEDHSDSEFEWPAHPRVLTAVHEEAAEIVRQETDDGHKVIVFGVSVDAMELLAQTLGKEGLSVAVVHGGISDKARQEVFRRCRVGEIQVLVGTFGTLAEGLNLSFATRAVILDTTWDPSTMKQAIARITRGVQEVEPKVYFVSARGTIQQFMIRLCRAKQAAIDAGLDRRSLRLSAEDLPDIQSYVASLVGVGDPNEIPERLFALEQEVV